MVAVGDLHLMNQLFQNQQSLVTKIASYVGGESSLGDSSAFTRFGLHNSPQQAKFDFHPGSSWVAFCGEL